MLSQVNTADDLVIQGVFHLLYDSHGSTRALMDAAALVIQRFAYDAYGVMLDAATLTTATNAATNLLYSGEWTSKSGQQYLRARWYNPESGRFNRVDPFVGNAIDPISLHKYLYTHGNPVAGIDPSGEVLFSIIGALLLLGITLSLSGSSARPPVIATRMATGLGGPDITSQLHFIRADLLYKYKKMSSSDKQLYANQFYQNRAENWDIAELASQSVKVSGSTPGTLPGGTNTVTVMGSVFPQEEVNYWIYGVWIAAIGESLLEADTTISFYRKYTVDIAGILPIDAWGTNGAEGRIAWVKAGYYNDFSYVIPTAINGATPNSLLYPKFLKYNTGSTPGRIRFP